MMMMMFSLTFIVMCLISKISMNVTLVTTRVQQHKYVSISREGIHAWILYSVFFLTLKLVTSELFVLNFQLPLSIFWMHLHLCSIIFFSNTKLHLLTKSVKSVKVSKTFIMSMCPPLQSVYVFSWEPCLQGQALHYFVPTHGLVVGAQCACRHLPDAGHHALPRCLLHLPDKVWQRRTRVLHEGEYFSDTYCR